jgi:hypothetical protein
MLNIAPQAIRILYDIMLGINFPLAIVWPAA